MTLPIFMPTSKATPAPLPIGVLIAEGRERMGFRSQPAAARESARLEEIDPSEYQSFSQQWLSQIEDIRSTAWLVLERRGTRRLRSLEKITGLDILSKIGKGSGRNNLDQQEDDPMAHLRVSPLRVKIQRVGWVNAGNSDVFKLAPIDEYDEIPKQQLLKMHCNLDHCFTYLVNGDSMVTDAARTHPKGIADGDLIVVERYRVVMPDDIVVIWDKTDEKMLVKVVKEGDSDGYLVFKSLNHKYPPIFRHESEVKIYGVKVWRGG
ncbi:MAG: hypothetical protein HC933_00470 [Pleurocapsa sp. SU_196_0]|nr:hypothetical protein [Pleurocapsa sp. SU_196_0]